MTTSRWPTPRRCRGSATLASTASSPGGSPRGGFGKVGKVADDGGSQRWWRGGHGFSRMIRQVWEPSWSPQGPTRATCSSPARRPSPASPFKDFAEALTHGRPL